MMNELQNTVVDADTSIVNLKEDKPPSEEADGVSDRKNGESDSEQVKDKKVPYTNSIEELKKLSALISIRMAENDQKPSKMKSIFSSKKGLLPPVRNRIIQQRLHGRRQNAHQPHIPITCWNKFIRMWDITKWVRRFRRRMRRRRRRLLLQILQNAQNPPPPRNGRRINELPFLIRVRIGLSNFFGLRRPVRIAPVHNDPGIGNHVNLLNVGAQQQNVARAYAPPNRSTMDRTNCIIHNNNTLRRRTHLIELFDVDLTDPLPTNTRTEVNFVEPMGRQK